MSEKTKKTDIINSIISYIKANGIQPGHSLPSERKFAEILSVSRNTLREAIRLLEERQILEVHKGSGCYLKTSVENIKDWDEFRSMKNPFLVQNQLEARFLIIPSVAALVIDRMNEADIKELEKTVIRLSQATIKRKFSKIAEEDNKFREIIAKSTNNPILVMMIKQLETNNQLTWELFKEFPEEEINKIFACYVKTLEAIRERNVKKVKLNIENNVLTMCSLLMKFTDVKFSDQMINNMKRIYNIDSIKK